MIDSSDSFSYRGSDRDDEDGKLMKELRIKDEKLTKEMYDAVLNPTTKVDAKG
jgi:hypothetical protein